MDTTLPNSSAEGGANLRISSNGSASAPPNAAIAFFTDCKPFTGLAI
jgi:hypothetical protein